VTLVDLADGMPQLRLAPGDALDRTTLPETALILVSDGLVVMRTSFPGSTRRMITSHAGAGALMLPPENGDVLVALTEAALVPISAGTRDELLGSREAARLLVDGLEETLRQKHGAIVSLSRLHHVDRVREKLIELAREHGRVGRDGIRLDFPLTHDLLGEMVGSARETVTRALDELQREGFVVRRGRTYSVNLEPEQLAAS
jgi:Crp-like helix-turn-helix domain